MEPEQEKEILALRDRKLTPKQIARKLGLKVSQVSNFIKQNAEQVSRTRAAAGELAPVAQCLIDRGSIERLFKDNDRGDGIGGLGQILLSRSSGYNRFEVCTYLIDYWCLGLKDTMGPQQFSSAKQQEFVRTAFSRFPSGYEEITLAQAQEIVFGAIDYAATLGFEPHADFKETKAFLGQWDGKTNLKFGRNGKPYYIEGPYDNAKKVFDTLKKNVGEGNFEYVVF